MRVQDNNFNITPYAAHGTVRLGQHFAPYFKHPTTYIDALCLNTPYNDVVC